MSRHSKEELIEALHRSVRDLQQGIDMHTCLLSSILENEVDEHHLKPFATILPQSREARLKEALMEAITVLEESRKSFKSKRLEALRKQLTQVLIDTEPTC